MMKRKTKNTIKMVKNKNGGITLIALVITVIVLLILARNKYFYAYRREWIINKSRAGKREK